MSNLQHTKHFSPLVKLPLTLEQVRRERLRRKAENSLASFVRAAWSIVDPAMPLVSGWHIDAVCEHLEAVSSGQIRRLLINIPPGHGKSKLVAVYWPAWMWLRQPSWRVLTASYAQDLSNRDAVYSRDLLQSQWYRETFAPSWRMKSDQNVKSYYANDAGGERLAISVGSKVTGFRGNGVIVDDPLNARDIWSHAALEEASDFVTRVVPTRLNDPRSGFIVVCMQRLHKQDPSGVLLDRGGWEHVNLPTEFDPQRRTVTCIGWTDPRKERGELLFPQMFNETVVEELRRTLGPLHFAAQHNQAPRELNRGDRRISGFTATGDNSSVVAAGSIVSLDPRAAWQFGLGMDHGELAQHECVYLVAWQEQQKRAIVCSRYISQSRMAYEGHAPYIREMVEQRNALSLKRLSFNVGDINSAANSSGESVNQVLSRALDGLTIQKPVKTSGSIDEGVILIDLAFRNGTLKVDPECVELIDALNMWTGDDDQFKHHIDAIRYILYPILRRFIYGGGGAKTA